MEKIALSKGFKLKLSGMPDTSVIHLPRPATVGVCALDIPHIRPKLLVKEKDRVKTGTPLFCDKRDTGIQYVSPGTGTVKKILFGKRRRLLEVVITLEGMDDFVQFDPVSAKDLSQIPAQKLADHLKQGGVWQFLRQLPARDTADSATAPPLIIVCLNGNDIFSPHPGLVLQDNIRQFAFGLSMLKRFSDRVIVAARTDSLALLAPAKHLITLQVPDTYPAWDPGAILYHIKKEAKENAAWYIGVQDLVRMAQFLETGRYPFDTMVTVTRGSDKKPHMITRQGSQVRLLAGNFSPGSLITTGQLNGRIKDPDAHLGFFENTLNIIPDAPGDEMFGFIRPGLNKPTVSKAFLSSLVGRKVQMDCTMHGEERACINCSYCENICPVDLMPSFIMKALVSDDIEEALELGLLDCCRCGLCSFTCPSKIELARILSLGMDAHHKDTQG
ncbi:MAG: NADH-quinone reductase [Desulfotignum sp.]|nr:NADH-quinone reductase [Desulfotignum sp.]MCF8125207.1 NADH-quinone reductase [Desulfotignum sp.]